MGALSRIVATGLAGAAASALVAIAFSRAENGHGRRPLNAIAHIYDGGPPAAHDGTGARNTVLGATIHTCASIWWATFYEAALSGQPRRRRWSTALAVSAIAYLVDYCVVGKRFQPGFERYLSPRAMFAVYAALAAGYALSGKRGALVGERQHQRERAALPRGAREPQLSAEQARQLAADR